MTASEGLLAEKPATYKLHFPYGAGGGLWRITRDTMDFLVLVWSRRLYQESSAKAKYSKDLDRQGVYVLWGPAEKEAETTPAYIGEGQLRSRLDQHELKKEFWQEVLLFTLKQGDLSKDIGHYLERKLYERAHETGRALLNQNKPGGSSTGRIGCRNRRSVLRRDPDGQPLPGPRHL